MTSRIFTKIPNFEKLKPTRDFFLGFNFIALAPLNDADHGGETRFLNFQPVPELSSWKDNYTVCTIFLNLFSLSISLLTHILYQFLCIFGCSTQQNKLRVSTTSPSPPRGEKLGKWGELLKRQQLFFDWVYRKTDCRFGFPVAHTTLKSMSVHHFSQF